jgi:hypothetical protein
MYFRIDQLLLVQQRIERLARQYAAKEGVK